MNVNEKGIVAVRFNLGEKNVPWLNFLLVYGSCHAILVYISTA